MLLFCLKSVSWTCNELTWDDVENWENCQLTLTNLSHLLWFCINQQRKTLENLSVSDISLPSASSTKSFDTSKKKWKLQVRFSPTKESRVHQRRFRRRVSKTVCRLRYSGQDYNKTTVTERLVCFVCVLFSMEKSMLRMDSCVRFCCHNILFLRTKCGEGSP